MSRWKASGIHLLICMFIAVTVAVILFFVWYPQPYFDALGGKRLLIILLSVDLVLGPLITLIIYNEKKKSLKFDLATIGFIQIAALFYGVSVLFEARPVYLVFTVDRFEVVVASDLLPEELDRVEKNEYKSLSIMGPKLVTALLPESKEKREEILFSALEGGPDLQGMPRYYVPYQQTKNLVNSRIVSLDKVSDVQIDFKTEMLEQAKDSGLSETSIGFLPVRAGNIFITALMNKDTTEIVKLIPLDPWG